MSNCDLNGLGQLDVSVSALDQPCKTSDRTWYITIWCCDGTLLKYCNREYIVIEATCGTASIRLPAGRYVVSAVWGYTQTATSYQGNHFTDRAIVNVCCAQCQCVTLFNPHIHRCGQILMRAATDLETQPGTFDAAQLAALQTAMDAVFAAAPLPGPQFDLDPQVDALADLREQMAQTGLGNAINSVKVQHDLAIDYVAAVNPPPA